jgi:hypothetical protein
VVSCARHAFAANGFDYCEPIGAEIGFAADRRDLAGAGGAKLADENLQLARARATLVHLFRPAGAYQTARSGIARIHSRRP